jgi:hypothetical protein
MIDFSELSLETFQVLRAYGKDIVLYDEHGNRVFEPSDARRFYISGDNILVSILNDGDNSAVKVYLSTNIQISEVLEFVTVLRRIATQFNVLFNVRKYNKKITPRDFATQAAVKEQKEYSMNIMEGLYGTSKSSYLKLENARMIVRHSARVKENMIGGRGRSIQSIFVENAQGERFLFPVNVLSGARAMTQHVNHGGTFADEVGQQIIRMAQDFSDLSKVAGHIGANQKSLPSQAMRVRESIRSGGHDIRRTFERMCRDEASYIRESARITEAKALTEGSESIAEAVEALQSLLSLGGVAMDESILETVAKYVSVMEDMRPDSNPADDTKDPDDGKPVQPVKPTQPVAPGQSQNSDDDQDGDDDQKDGDSDNQNGSFHEDEEMEDDTVDEEEELDGDEVAETAAIRAFDAWMESFDPDSFFGEGKSFKRNKDDNADEKKKEDKNKRDDKRGKQERTDESFEMVSPEMLRDYGYDVSEVPEHVRSDADRWSKKFEITYVPEGSNDFPQVIGVEYDLDSAWDLAAQHFAERQGAGLAEGKSFKRNKDENADEKKKEDKNKRDDKRGKHEPVEEGKSFKRNDDDAEMTASERKKKDQEKRDAAKNKKVPVTESAEGTYEVYGNMGMKSKPFRKSFKSEAARSAWLDKNEGNLDIHGYADPEPASVEEGKSFKRNKDEDAIGKKKEDKQRRDTQRDKQEPIEESVFDDEDDEDNPSSDHDANYFLHDLANFEQNAVAYIRQKLTGTVVRAPLSAHYIRKALQDYCFYELELNDFYDISDWVVDNFVQEQFGNIAKLLGLRIVGEGKSFKRNDDDEEMTAAEKKKQDQQKRDAAKNKKTPVEETRMPASVIKQKQNIAAMTDAQKKERFKGKTVEQLKKMAWGHGYGPNSMVYAKYATETPVEEGKSFKRNDDDEEMTAAEKKKKDQQKRDAAKSKKERTDEASDISFNDAKVQIKQVKGQLAKMSPFDKNYVSMKAHLQKLEDRLSRNGDDDLDEDSIVDSSSDELAEDSENAGWYVVTQKFAIVAGPFESKQEGWEYCKAHQHATADSLAVRFGTNEDPSVEGGDFMSQIEEASDISFNDAKSEIKSVKAKLNGMNPFDKDYVSTKARLHKLEDRLSRNGDDDLDEAVGGEGYHEGSDIPVDGSEASLAFAYQHGCESASNGAGSYNPYPEELPEHDAWYRGHRDTNDGEETDESYVSGDGGYGGDTSDVIESEDEGDAWAGEDKESWLGNGNPVKFKAGTGYEHPGIWTPSQVNMERGRCWVGDDQDRGWYVYIDHLEPHHGEDDEVEEDLVIPRNMSSSLASEVEKKKEPEGDDDGQGYISRLRTLAGMNKI